MYSKDLRPTSHHAYPEKVMQDLSPFEDRVQSWLKSLETKVKLSQKQLNNIIKNIEVASDMLEKDTHEQLMRRLKVIKEKLIKGKLDEKNCIQAFALVREFSQRVLGMKHYPVQLMGGWVLMHGRLAEMNTGEGKTLTATLPCATAALAGIPVHVITTNDYLAKRDAQTMQPLYEALGLTVGYVEEQMSNDMRVQMYQRDIVYCSNKILAFDYLRDRMVLEGDNCHVSIHSKKTLGKNLQLYLRGLCFAIVDEADSVLIDEARTPLIIAKAQENKTEVKIYRQALWIAHQLKEGQHYIKNKNNQSQELLPEGEILVEHLCQSLHGIWKTKRRRNHLIHQALSALYTFKVDEHYMIKDEKIQIIDANTGRAMADRSWEKGLHQMIEIKEGMDVSMQQETMAKMTFQRFFRRYLILAGMSGTASEMKSELASVYHLPVVKIPTHLPSKRKDLGFTVFAQKEDKYQQVIQTVKQIHRKGQPILIGTSSVKASEAIARLLQKERLNFELLNARQDEREAQMISRAGHKGAITVATNMAGRGTDIKLSDEVKQLGGLHVIITELNDSSRVDRQLYGRCARQNDPGSYQVICSLNDALCDDYYTHEYLMPILQKIAKNQTTALVLKKLIMRWPQYLREHQYKKERHNLLKFEESMSSLLAFTGQLE